jgi:hypothetical protein
LVAGPDPSIQPSLFQAGKAQSGGFVQRFRLNLDRMGDSRGGFEAGGADPQRHVPQGSTFASFSPAVRPDVEFDPVAV